MSPRFLLVTIIDRTFFILYLFILIRIIAGWVRIPYNPLLRQFLDLVYIVTEPILRPFRGVMPTVNLGGVGLDISPIIAIFVLQIVNYVIDQVILTFI